MPRLSGIEVATRQASSRRTRRSSSTQLIGDRALLSEALDVGARGFVLKEAPLPDLVRAVERVAAGDAYVDPVLAGVLVSGAVREGPDADAARARSAAAAGRRTLERGDRQAALHLARNRAHPRPQGDGEARGRHAHAGRRDCAAPVSDLVIERERPLRRADLDPDPLVQFRALVRRRGRPPCAMPEAGALATATPTACPRCGWCSSRGSTRTASSSSRTATSRKGRELDANPRAALLLYWDPLGRQVRVEGPVERVPDAASRTRTSRPGRAARRSAPTHRGRARSIPDRATLEERVAELEAELAGRDVPRPEYVGRLPRSCPETWEFWQHRDSRLHDRFRYRRDGRRLGHRAPLPLARLLAPSVASRSSQAAPTSTIQATASSSGSGVTS